MLDINFAQLARFKATAKTARGALVLTIPQQGKNPAWLDTIDRDCFGKIKKAVASSRFEAKAKQVLSVVAPEGLQYDQLILVGLGKGKEITPVTYEQVGGTITQELNRLGVKQASIIVQDVRGCQIPEPEAAVHLAIGLESKSYRFDKYLTKEEASAKPTLQAASVFVNEARQAQQQFEIEKAVLEGVMFTRDLVNEPGNVLHPVSFAEHCKSLSQMGVDVKIIGEKELEKMGAGALLGVGRGSEHESQIVVMQWNGSGKKDQPIAFVGKGVTFDTGGISLKPSGGMEDMKTDMGGAGAVVGLMKALAGRKAKVNAVGVVGLVENMPAHNAQRPGDIVTSLSGQTIEVLNTDAEGRLVLADCLWYTQDTFKPKFMVNLATLTGAIVVALGESKAGLYANDDKLADHLKEAGETVGEPLWRMPLGPEYDKLLDSPIADMQNISSGRYGGSITAAQFLQRFVNDTPWAHLDIAGVANQAKASDICSKGASGFGVRLLNQLISRWYEKSK